MTIPAKVGYIFSKVKIKLFSSFVHFWPKFNQKLATYYLYFVPIEGGNIYLMSSQFFATKRESNNILLPQQNGVAERRNRTIMERARSLSTHCDLPLFLWSEAVSTANYLINRSPTCANNGMTPEEKYTGQKPSLEHLRIFGCLAFRHVPKEGRKKLDSKSAKCLFLGYDSASKAFRVYDADKRKILITRDIIFDETRIGFTHLTKDKPASLDPYTLGSPFTGHDSPDSSELSQDVEPLLTPQPIFP